MKALYLLIHVFTISFPLLRSFEPRIRYASKWKALFTAMTITAAFFIMWDVIFTKLGVWGFNEAYHLSLIVFGLPIEEWLFFFTVPFASVFIYECVKYFIPNARSNKYVRNLTLLLGSALIVIAFLYQHQLYTFWNFLFAGFFLIGVGYSNPTWLAKFWIAYALHLIPFLLVNGILTGSWIQDQIVWYNDQENLSIRLWTIPIEDSIYALLLLLMNITLFEWFTTRLNEKT